MTRLGLVLLAFTLAGCSWFRDDPGIPPGATLVYTGSPGSEIFSVCDRGSLVYLSRASQQQVAVIPNGCNPDLGKPGSPAPLAVAAVAEPRTPPATTPAPPPFTLPQPFVVQIVPTPTVPVAEPRESREQILVVPQPCPACPAWTPQPTPLPAPKAAPKPQPAAKVVVVPAVDPNTASQEDLERLPGVTAKMAQAVVRGRPYRTLHEIAEKKALSEADLAALAPYLAIR